MKGDLKIATAYLVEEAGLEGQYLTDATFHNAVDTLVQMLPFMLQGLANECRRERIGRDKAVAEMLMSTWTKPRPDPAQFIAPWPER